MDYRNIVKNIGYSLAIILVVSAVLIKALTLSNISETLKDGIIVEIIGSGFLGGIVAAIFFYLQELTEYQSRKNRALAFLRRLEIKLKEANERELSAWNLSGENKFYFDNSKLNYIYDVYDKYSSEIAEYGDYLKSNKLVSLLEEIYFAIRKGYVLGEKIDNALYEIVRSYNHKQGLIAANDPPVTTYIKAKLFSGLTDEDVMKYLQWKEVSGTAKQALAIATENPKIKNLNEKIKISRNALLKKLDKLLKILVD